ncbi:hypothetical protein K492DRAFT_202767 [Lichtheimia hyalospora FSU 10163]|nr:hypothetical protein K492DRAFT_202767 [Lichtheimia hyalospora FSU 10163]
MDSDNSDDEYGPVMAAWGDQTQPANTSIDSNASPGWDTLLDPTFKIKSNGIGSGDLHRKGRNYKPVNEDEILRQRLKLPSTQPNNKKKRPQKASSKASSYHDSNYAKQQQQHQQQKRIMQSAPSTSSSMKRSQPTPTPPPPPPPPPTIRPPPKVNNAWTQQSLVSEPFWEHPPPSSGQQNNHTSAPSSSTTASTTIEQERYGGLATSLKPDPRPQRPTSMRPPPGLFRNAINRLEVNTSSPNKKPPGLSPIPTNPQLQHHSFKSSNQQTIPAMTHKQQINPVVIRINIELESGNTVQVPVRLYDDPLALANEFSRSHNVTSPQVVMHLQKLFKDQQQLAIRKRQPTM